jgi:hypothetical protein
MRILTQLGEFETRRVEDEHLAGLIEVENKPPDGLEDPSCPDYKLRYDVVMIDNDSPNPNDWEGSRIYWDQKEWLIIDSLNIKNGEKALLELEQLPHYHVTLWDLWECIQVEVRTPADDKTHAGVVARRDLNGMDRFKVLKVDGPLYHEKSKPKWTSSA